MNHPNKDVYDALVYEHNARIDLLNAEIQYEMQMLSEMDDDKLIEVGTNRALAEKKYDDAFIESSRVMLLHGVSTKTNKGEENE